MTCVNRITNDSPLVVNRNTRDVSGRTIPVTPTPLPQHMPVWFLQTAKGPEGPNVVTAAERNALYGASSFNPTGRYANHQTIGSNIVTEEANTSVLWRLSKGDYSSLILYLDMAESDVDVVDRDASGRIILDATGNPTITGTTPGYSARLRVGAHPAGFNPSLLGTLTPVPGGMQGGSTLYPIAELINQTKGADGDNAGIRLWVQPEEGIDVREMLRTNSFPYEMAILSREDKYNSPVVEESILGDKSATVSFSTNAISEFGGSSYGFKDVIKTQYSNTTDTRYTKLFGAFNDYIHVYQENIDSILKLFAMREKTYLEANPAAVTAFPYDTFSPAFDQGEQHLFNFITGKDHTGIPYYTFAFDEDVTITDGVVPSRVTNIWAKNGSDNLMSTTEYEREVRSALNRYTDCNDPIQDLARHPESILYDTGFSPLTKHALSDFISQRPDTFVAVQTQYNTMDISGYSGDRPNPLPEDWVEPTISRLSHVDEMALATSLRAKLLLQPESEYFGTPTFRAMIMTASGEFRVYPWRHRVGFNFWLMKKAAAYMGASNGRWDSNSRFSRAPSNIIDNLTNVDHPWIPAQRRVRIQDIGVNYPLTYDMDRLFMPQLRTIHPDATSVLTNFNTAMAVCYLYKIAYKAWREFSGTDDLTGAELVEAVNDFVEREAAGIFDGRYIIDSEAYLSPADINRGYSWTLVIHIAANKMYTVQELHIESHRFDDYIGGLNNG